MARRRGRSFDNEGKARRTRRVVITRAEVATNSNDDQGPASRTRSRKKIKLDEVASIQGCEEPRLEDHQANIDLWSNVPSKPWIPEKRVLELILDILQRRDKHELFAEPVDSEEVEDYYEIIKEPMDFGTMRAKLHEGLYKNLDQFENDMFLITKNAMHFNPSASMYFRQARVVNELAIEVFRVLKAHPGNFELEFSKSRRRNARRSQGEAGKSLHRTRPKVARRVKSNSTTVVESPKSMPCSGLSPCSNARVYEVPCWGRGDNGGSRSIQAERRCTYKPQMPSLDEDESIISLISTNKKQLEHVVQNDIGYRKSLILFAKDLGPAVQSIARQKLSGSFSIQNRRFSTTTFYAKESAITAPTSSVDHFPVRSTFGTNITERMEAEDSDTGKKIFISGEMAARIHQNQSSEVLLASSLLARSGDSSSALAGLKTIGNNSTTIADRELELDFWQHSCNSSKLKLKNAHESGFSREDDDQVKSEDGQALTSDRCKPFELPFSNFQLGQTNAFGRLAFLQRSSEVNFFDI